MEFNKKIIIFMAILLVGLLVIGSATAADIANENNATGAEPDSALSATNDNEKLEINENNNVLTASPKTFTDLNNTINGNSNKTIDLYDNYAYNGGTDSAFKEGIVIGREVSIDGHGITINGSDSARIFKINTNDKVTLKNITFTQGYVADDGGAIYGGPSSSYTAINCTFSGNNAYSGGAMVCGTAINCTFSGNNAISGDGGAMDNGTAISCTFSGNEADNGGAMVCGTAINCTFLGNEAISGDGGAMFSGTAIGCTFSDNKANILGGAMGSGGTAIACTFSGNEAMSGGAMYYGSEYLCIFENYVADCSNTDQLSGVSASLSVSNTIFSEEEKKLTVYLTCEYQGEKYWIDNFNTTISILQDGVWKDHPVMTGQSSVLDLPFGAYTANFTVKANNSEVKRDGVQLKVTQGTTFSDLNQAINGNAANEITLDKNYKFNETVDSEFTDGIIINRAVTINGNGHTINATKKSRIFKVTSDYVTLNNITFTEGFSADYGGAIYWSSNTTNILNCYFVNNTADGFISCGGANYFFYDLHDSNINATFTDNKAKDCGGANYFYNKVTNVNITGDYSHNTASSGGANYFSHAVDNVNLTGNYSYNTAWYGGANRFMGAVTNVDITGNYNNNAASDYGGANFFANPLTNVNIIGDYSHNTAEVDDGGANFFQSAVTNVDITGNYNDNAAKQGSGGANYFLEVNNVLISGSFTNNNGSSTIYMKKSIENNIIKDSIFLNNTGTNIRVYSGSLQVTDCWFGNNASNYDTNITNSNGATISNWLFLNATANPSAFSFMQTSDISFELYAYNESAPNKVSDYDNSLIQPIELEITSVNGTVDKSIAALNKTVKYTPKSIGRDTVTATFATVQYDFELSILKAASSVVIKGITDGVYNTTAPTVDYEVIYPTTVTFTINCTDGTLVVSKAIGELDSELSKLDQGAYTITIINAEDENYTASNATTPFTVYRAGSSVVINGISNGVYNTTAAVADYVVINETEVTFTINRTDKTKVVSGNIAELQTELFKLNAGSYVITISNAEKGNFNASNATASFTVYRASSSVTINNVLNGIYNTTATVVNYDIKNQTTVTFTISNETTSVVSDVPIDELQTELFKLDAGTYAITIINAQDNSFNASNATDSFTVYRAGSSVVINGISNGVYNTTAAVVDYDIENETEATFTINRTDKTPVVSNKISELVNELFKLDAGSYVIAISNAEKGNFNASSAVSNPFTVYRAGSNVVINGITNGVYNTATAVVNYDVKNQTAVAFTINNETTSVVSDVSIDKLQTELFKLNAGNYIITINNAQNDNFNASNATSNMFTVQRASSSVTISPIVNVTYGSDSVIEFTVVNATQVSWEIINRDTSASVDSGIGLDSIVKSYAIGNYTITVSNALEGNYNASSTSMNFTVNKAASLVVINDIETVVYGNNVTVGFAVSNDTAVTYAVRSKDGKPVIANTTIADLQKNLILSGLGAGEYTITIANAENENYTQSSASKDFTITKANAYVNVTADPVTYGSNVIVEITGSVEGTYAVKVNGITQQITITKPNESVKVDFGVLAANAAGYAIFANYVETDNYTGIANTTAKVTVNKIKTKLTAKAVTATYNINKYLVVTLKDANGNPVSGAKVSVKLGTTKTYTTNKKGQIKVPTKSLAPKKYAAKIVFKGTSIYVNSTAKVNVVVKKAKPKLTAKKKTFKKSVKTKKYTVILKTNKNKVMKKVKLTIKVNKKTYKAKTNKKGVATFKITKLTKKGKYTAVVKFAGNKYYNAKTVKSKIIVK